MSPDDRFRQGLNANIRELQTVLQIYDDSKVSQEEQMKKLSELQHQLSKNIEEMHDILQPRVAMKVSALLNKAEKPEKKFSRAKFYSLSSPYIRRMDKSKSYRIVPPMRLKNEPPLSNSATPASSQFFLSSLQLLENIRNLQRLRQTSASKDVCVDRPINSFDSEN